MVMRVVLLAAAILLVHSPVEAEPPATYAMHLNGRALTGPGADMLRAEIRYSDMILIGEEHGFAGSAEILRALTPDAKAAGFSYYAIEVSPLAAKTFGEAWKAGGVEAMQKLVHDNPLAFPFISLNEDAELAAEFLGEDANGVPYLWGLDQEFIGSPTLLLQRLAELAPNDKVRARVALMLSGERAAQQSGETGKLLLMNATEAGFDSLDADFAGTPEAQDIVEAMRVSAEIYQLHLKGEDYKSNARRARLMSEAFLAAYRGAAADPPKVIVRMGAYHTGLGTTPTQVVDIGTLAYAAAKLNGRRALRIAFLPAGGRRAAFLPTPGNPYVVSEYADADIAELMRAIEINPATLPRDQWTLTPLPQARERLTTERINALGPLAKFVVLGFDYLITAPDARPATPLY